MDMSTDMRHGTLLGMGTDRGTRTEMGLDTGMESLKK